MLKWRSLILVACRLAALFGLALTAVNASNPKSWRTFSVPVEGVVAADLSPDSHSVAFMLYRSVVTDKPPRFEMWDDLEVWDFRQSRLIARKTMRKSIVFTTKEASEFSTSPGHVRYTPDGRSLIVFDGSRIRILETTEYQDIRQISVDRPPTNDAWGLGILKVSPDSTRLVVKLVWEKRHGELFRLYDLISGKLQGEWKIDEEGVNWIGWSPDGRKLALTWLATVQGRKLPPDIHNLLVLDASSGEKLLGINTGYLAGPVAFGADNTILTVALINPNALRTAHRDTIKIWDAGTGKLLRQIASPPTGVHDQLETSADGRIVLGYVGRYKRIEFALFTVYHQFRLWNVLTGEVIATSPEIPPQEDKVLLSYFRLSRKGDVALFWPWISSVHPVVYELVGDHL